MPKRHPTCLNAGFTACCAAMTEAHLPTGSALSDSLRTARILAMPKPAPIWSGRCGLPASSIPDFWRHWLTDNGSLTQRLIELKPGHFRVRLLREYRGHATPLEYRALGLSIKHPVWIREVSLCIDDDVVVFGRTVIPISTLTGKHTRLLSLGERSLGSYLFRQPGIFRRSLSFARVHEPRLPVNWCRRSVFSLDNKPLLVTESFTEKLRLYS